MPDIQGNPTLRDHILATGLFKVSPGEDKSLTITTGSAFTDSTTSVFTFCFYNVGTAEVFGGVNATTKISENRLSAERRSGYDAAMKVCAERLQKLVCGPDYDMGDDE